MKVYCVMHYKGTPNTLHNRPSFNAGRMAPKVVFTFITLWKRKSLILISITLASSITPGSAQNLNIALKYWKKINLEKPSEISLKDFDRPPERASSDVSLSRYGAKVSREHSFAFTCHQTWCTGSCDQFASWEDGTLCKKERRRRLLDWLFSPKKSMRKISQPCSTRNKCWPMIQM